MGASCPVFGGGVLGGVLATERRAAGAWTGLAELGGPGLGPGGMFWGGERLPGWGCWLVLGSRASVFRRGGSVWPYTRSRGAAPLRRGTRKWRAMPRFSPKIPDFPGSVRPPQGRFLEVPSGGFLTPSLKVGVTLCEAQCSARLAKPRSLLPGLTAQAARLKGYQGECLNGIS